MKKTLFLLMGLMVVSAVSFSADQKSISSSLDAIEAKFEDLLKKEEQKRVQFQLEKEQLEKEIADLQAKEAKSEKLKEKLELDSEVRWHRDKYRQILREYNKYNGNVSKLIEEKTKRLVELETVLSIMQ